MNTQTAVRKLHTREPGLYGSDLKLIALLTMIIDHTGAGLIKFMPGIQDTESIIYAVYWLLRIIGRLAFPIFCFLIVEGISHTRNKYRYALRMFIFGVISEIPFDLALYNSRFDWKHQNVFFTLALGIICLTVFELIREHNCHLENTSKWAIAFLKYETLILVPIYLSYRSVSYIHKYTTIALREIFLYIVMYIIGFLFLYGVLTNISNKQGNTNALVSCIDISTLVLAMLISDLAHTDYASVGVLTIAVMYLLRNNLYRQITSGCAVLAALLNPVELATFATVPLVLKYNEKRGYNIKLLFYVIYPLHLLIIYVIRRQIL